MIEALRVSGRAFRLWWGELPLLTLLNVAWLALQVPLVTGPAATAAMYVVAGQIAQGELVDARTGWQALRRVFWPALGWGALNLLVAAAVCVNFAVYGSLPGLGWAALRLAWGAIAVLWFALNLVYWPFWLAQHDRRVTITYRNALLLYLKAPGFALMLMVVCAILILVSVATTLPLAVALMAWLALIGVLAVEEALRRPAAAEGSALADAGVEIDAL